MSEEQCKFCHARLMSDWLSCDDGEFCNHKCASLWKQHGELTHGTAAATNLQTLHAALVDAVLNPFITGELAKKIARTIRRIDQGTDSRPIAEIMKELGLGE